MGIRRRTRRIRRWYRQREHSAGMLAARIALAATGATAIAIWAL
jgi:4'-phosphopantetheinyl transferase EntD